MIPFVLIKRANEEIQYLNFNDLLMKPIFYSILCCLLFLTSCSSDSEDVAPEDEIPGLIKMQSLENNHHLLELYSKSGALEEGYNEIFIRIRDKSQQEFLNNAEIQWQPVMDMHNMQHSAPKSEITKMEGEQSLYTGFIVFPMAENESETWSLTINYTVDGVDYLVNEAIQVLPSERRRVSAFKGADDSNYVLALVAPSEPEIATNDLKLGLFKMEDMMNYSVVEGYTFKMDPRMPGMGNHTSPNNVAPVQGEGDVFYNGKLKLTMSGLWRINLQLFNESGERIKGEPLSETNEQSSLFLELEF